ncbi:putative lipoate-protein ligase [Rhodococcus opacus B4]|uniref:Putative lipoate-protein ligase n=1 Tax=Rhodococcus opacus (strain B4) TaxID=632772 RepID=C1B656_RHOOB|nr:putative lipoate-protein ligase [Rhodococcus opacus B4]
MSQRGVALRWFALNCHSARTAYDAIITGGIRDVGVTSLSREPGREMTVAEVTRPRLPTWSLPSTAGIPWRRRASSSS